MSEAQQSLSDSIDHLHPSTARVVDFSPTLFWGFLLCRCSTHISSQREKKYPLFWIFLSFFGTCFVLMKTKKVGWEDSPNLLKTKGGNKIRRSKNHHEGRVPNHIRTSFRTQTRNVGGRWSWSWQNPTVTSANLLNTIHMPLNSGLIMWKKSHTHTQIAVYCPTVVFGASSI